jgi:aspartyl protease family protein
LAFCIFLLIQQAPFQPGLERIVSRIGLDQQEVVGGETRIRMASDGHFWAKATINGVERRMLIDSGATVTAVSQDTAAEAAIANGADMVPVVLRTANGMTPARTGTIEELRVGNITARNLKMVSSPALGELNVLGMNFLSRLASWRVEGRTLIMVPNRPQPGPHVD